MVNSNMAKSTRKHNPCRKKGKVPATGRYIETTVAGETVRAFVSNPLPPKLTE